MTSPLTPGGLAELRALYEQAKPGEWNLYKGSDRAIATIRFLSLAHNLMPALLDAVEERDRLRVEVIGLRQIANCGLLSGPEDYERHLRDIAEEEPHDPLVDMDISPETEQAARELAARRGLLTTGGDDA